MKKLAVLVTIVCSVLLGNATYAQSVDITQSYVFTAPNNTIVYVTGTLTGVKGIPITGYTVDLVDINGKAVRIATNVPSSGGAFNFAGVVPSGSKMAAPANIKITINRAISNQAPVTTGNCN
jgi:hypothetical protein